MWQSLLGIAAGVLLLYLALVGLLWPHLPPARQCCGPARVAAPAA
jgi:hypothetical protein